MTIRNNEKLNDETAHKILCDLKNCLINRPYCLHDCPNCCFAWPDFDTLAALQTGIDALKQDILEENASSNTEE